MTTAIIGGTGFIGPHVVERLRLRGEPVVVVARGQHPVSLPDGVMFERADRMDSARLDQIFAAHQVGTVIDIFALGLRNTQPLLDAVALRGARYLLVSSIDVYSNYGGLLRREEPPVQAAPAREDDPLRGFRYPYRGNPNRPKGVNDDLFEDYDKIVLEEAAFANARFATTAIRAPMIFGPGDKQHRFAWAIGAARQGGVIRVDERAADWPNSYGYVVDIAEAIVLAALDPRGAGRVYNVGQPFVRTPVEWLQRFAGLLGTRISIESVPPEAKGLLHDRADGADLRYPLTLDTTRIRTELGFAEPTDEDTALRATIAAESA